MTALRLLVWVAPIVFAYGIAAFRRPSRPLLTGVLLGIVWNLWAVLAVNIVAISMGWWSFAPGLPSFMGVPLEPWLGWSVLWGACAPLATFDRPISITLLAFGWLDLMAMPAMEPLLVLRNSWLVGEVIALGAAFLPGLLLARWTADQSNLGGRAALQALCSGALLIWLVPSVALHATGGWTRALDDVSPWQLSIALQALLLPVALGVRAVVEFARRGGGTPLPFDPPQRLVTSGPYSFMRNPMQLATVLMLAVTAAALRNGWIMGAAPIAFAYGVGLADWHEGRQLSVRFGDLWTNYRRTVRAWIPRWRPVVATESTLLVAYSCGTCSSIGRWFLARRPIGLRIAPAEESNDPELRRVTYVPADGPPSHGVGALARALEHIHLGWALVGWILAFPGISQFAQLVADVFGPAPQRVAKLAYDKAALRTES